ncbi:ABC transporter permease [Halococcus saccharolyticus]|uniref:Iron ABC transporter permease n=1 Tax=Halococcus saccharolyticus DSM 5350 TaxID=1227455 RepID=M0MI22_9EURY|nr:iron ABC transporter permease [Halococcus saccharolyticus]EMA45372.1 iron ABC transporter permease [Halococcus saccharolyticus DSM 5350]
MSTFDAGGIDIDRGRVLRGGLLALAGLVALAVVSPIVWLVVQAFDMGVESALTLLASPSTAQIAINSALLVTAVTVGSVLLGVPLAVLTARTDLPFRRFWTVVLALPLVVPSYIGAFAFVSAFGPRGVLADLLAPLGIESIPPIYGLHGTVLVLTLFVYPYVFLTTRAALLSFDASQVEAARTLNHSYFGAFRRVVLPQIAPGIAAGALLVGLYALSDFGTPSIMHYDVFTRRIFVEYNAFGRDRAALFSVLLLGLTVAIIGIESRLSPGDQNAYAGGRRGNTISLGVWTVPALALCTLVATLCLLVPLGILGMWLSRGGPGYTAGGFAFEWSYGINSVVVAVLAAAVATLAALPVGYLSARTNGRLANLFDRATYLGYAAPGIVIGFALVYFGVRYLPGLYQTLPLLIFAYVVRFLPQAVGSTHSSVLHVDRSLLEAARTLGHSPLSTFRRVTLPLIAPGVVAGAALVFLTTMKELPATLLLHPSEFKTLVTYIWQVQGAGYYGAAAVPALVLVAVSGLSMLVILTQEGDNVQ